MLGGGEPAMPAALGLRAELWLPGNAKVVVALGADWASSVFELGEKKQADIYRDCKHHITDDVIHGTYSFVSGTMLTVLNIICPKHPKVKFGRRAFGVIKNLITLVYA